MFSINEMIAMHLQYQKNATKPNNAYMKSNSNLENLQTPFIIKIYWVFDADARFFTCAPIENTSLTCIGDLINICIFEVNDKTANPFKLVIQSQKDD